MDAGLAVMAISVGWSFSSMLSGQVVHRLGEKKVILIGILAMGAGLAFASRLTAESTMLSIEIAALLIGIGMGTQTPALLAGVQNSVNPSEMGVATSTHMLARTIGGAIGVSMMVRC